MNGRSNLVIALLVIGALSMVVTALYPGEAPVPEVSPDQSTYVEETPAGGDAGPDAAPEAREPATEAPGPAQAEDETTATAPQPEPVVEMDEKTGPSPPDTPAEPAEEGPAVPAQSPPPAQREKTGETAQAEEGGESGTGATEEEPDEAGDESPVGTQSPPTPRISTSTDTLIAITSFPNVIHMEEPFNITGELREDNNSDGNVNSGDIPIPGAPVHLNFNEGSVFEVKEKLVTGNGTTGNPVGVWNKIVSSLEPRLGNVEISLYYNGEWFDENTGTFREDDGTIPQSWKNLPNTFLARHPCVSSKVFADFHHYTTLTCAVETKEVQVGHNLKVSGKLKDTDVPTNKLSDRVVELQFKGQPVAEDVTDSNGNYEFNYIVPENIAPGTWNVQINFDSSLNYTRNKWLEPSSASDRVRIYRHTQVKFHHFGDEAIGYRTHEITINGTVIDNMGEPPQEEITSAIGTENFYESPPSYKLFLYWGKETDRHYSKQEYKLNDTTGNFSLPFTIQGGTMQTEGPVNVTVQFVCDRAKGYYMDSESSNTYTVRVHTEVDLELDKEKNRYITRVEQSVYDPKTGDKIGVEEWNVVHLTGILKDADQSSLTNPRGIEDMNIHIYWQDQLVRREALVSTPENPNPFNPVKTGKNGVFNFAFKIDYGELLGSKTVRAAFHGATSDDLDYYDVSEVEQSGPPFEVVALTHIEIESKDVIKGENTDKDDIEGRLLDDRHIGIANQSIALYWRTGPQDSEGSPIEGAGNVVTDALGYFTHSDWVVPVDQEVGDAYVYAVYDGSERDSNGEFSVDDAYIGTESHSVVYNVSAYTHIEVIYSDDEPTTQKSHKWTQKSEEDYNRAYEDYLSDYSVWLAGGEEGDEPVEPDQQDFYEVTEIVLDEGKPFTRGDEFTIVGILRESYGGVMQPIPVKGATVKIYLGGELLGTEVTINDGTANDGNFQFTGTIPTGLPTGLTDLKVVYQPGNNTKTYKASEETTEHAIWANTYIQLVQGPSADSASDFIPDIHEERFDMNSEDYEAPLLFHFKVFESDTQGEAPVPVNLGRVTLDIAGTEAVFHNFTSGYTDENGNVVFNFTHPLVATLHSGTYLSEQSSGSQLVEINVTFATADGQYLFGSALSFDANYHPPPIPPQEGVSAKEKALLWSIIAIIIIMVIAAVLLLVYLDKQRRIRKMKRIIRRARDQLIAGNEYTAVIFKSYLKLSAHLRRYGYMRKEAETFREFEDAVRAALPIDRTSLNGFLEILEEARYSSHTMGDDQRSKAIDNLGAVEKSLEQVILDEEAMARAMEETEGEEFVETEIVVKDKPGQVGPGTPPPGLPGGAPAGLPAGPPGAAPSGPPTGPPGKPPTGPPGGAPTGPPAPPPPPPKK